MAILLYNFMAPKYKIAFNWELSIWDKTACWTVSQSHEVTLQLFY